MSRFVDWPPEDSCHQQAAYSRAAVFSGAGAEERRLADPWNPLPIEQLAGSSDYIVDSEALAAPPRRFRTLQAAVDQAIRDGPGLRPSGRRLIRLAPGLYEGPVYLPKESPPLALIGAGPGEVTLAARIDAMMPGREYDARFAGQFAGSVPAIRSRFARVAARETVTTGNTAVLRIERADTIVTGFTIRNDYACDRRSAAPQGAERDVEGRFALGQHQAVACHVAGADHVHLHDMHLESFQDTLYLQAPETGIGRSLLTNCLIEGDVDFIFGGATAFFDRCEIRTRGRRGARSWALAPSTNLWMAHGFVFDGCSFTNDCSDIGRNGTSFLGRQWFEGVRATPYSVPKDEGYTCRLGDINRLDGENGWINRRCLESVGKSVVQNSTLGAHISMQTPWDDWAAGAWSPRYRPVQTNGGDFLRNLDSWLQNTDLNYAEVAKQAEWLRVTNCREER